METQNMIHEGRRGTQHTGSHGGFTAGLRSAVSGEAGVLIASHRDGRAISL